MDETALYFLAGFVLWLVLNAIAVWRFDGWWRKAALVPAAVMALAVGTVVLGVLGGSNIAPIWLVFAIPVCLALILLLWILRAMAWALQR